MIRDGLQEFLSADPGVLAFVGRGPGTRIFPDDAPEPDTRDRTKVYFPRIVIEGGGATRPGTLTEQSEKVTKRLLLHCEALTRDDAKRLAKAVEDCQGGVMTNDKLDGFRGRWGRFFVHYSYVVDQTEGYAAPVHAQEKGVFINTLELEVVFDRQ